MDDQFLLRHVGLIALFAAVSILTVASLTLTQNISNIIFKPNAGKKAQPGDNFPPYEFFEGDAGILRARILTYSQKLFKYYAFVSFLVFLPVVMPQVADVFGGYTSTGDGWIWFGSGILGEILNKIMQYYPTFCLAVVVCYAMFIVRQVSVFKGTLLSVINA